MAIPSPVLSAPGPLVKKDVRAWHCRALSQPGPPVEEWGGGQPLVHDRALLAFWIPLSIHNMAPSPLCHVLLSCALLTGYMGQRDTGQRAGGSVWSGSAVAS